MDLSNYNRHIKPVGQITWQSQPDYDDWGPDSWWSCDEWVQWYYALKAKYGKRTAKSTWTTAYLKIDGFEHANWCRYNRAFNDMIVAEGLSSGSNTIADLIMGGGSLLDGGGDLLRLIGKALPIAAVVVGGAYLLRGKPPWK